MRVLIWCAVALGMLSASTASAQQADSTAAIVDSVITPAPVTSNAPPLGASSPAAAPKRSLRDRVYFGGSVTLSFGDVTRIGVYPMIAYKLTPKLSAGLELGYEYLKYDDFDQSASNFGGSVFSRYRLLPQLFAHAEYQMVNYEIFTSPTTSDREWVPFLLVGGGFSSRMGPNTWGYVEVLFDILNDDNSPYDDGEPIISVGVGVGF